MLNDTSLFTIFGWKHSLNIILDKRELGRKKLVSYETVTKYTTWESCVPLKPISKLVFLSRQKQEMYPIISFLNMIHVAVQNNFIYNIQLESFFCPHFKLNHI